MPNGPQSEHPWAVITGASSGIGLELAKLFAADRWNLFLVARNQPKLERLSAELKSQDGIRVEVLAHDLSRAKAASAVFDATRHIPVAALVNNAGFGSYGSFAQTALRTHAEIMQVNMSALVELTHLFLQPMLAGHQGRILNVASTAAFQPGPNVNIYYASKAFVYSFTYALAIELAGTGVTATVLCPGMTRTDFFNRANVKMNESLAMDAGVVAKAGYVGMLKGKRVVIPGLLNKVMSFLSKRTPPALTARVVQRIHAPQEQKS